MSRRRPVVTASTKAKDSTELAGTQRSLAFPVKVTHTHKLRTTAGPRECMRKSKRRTTTFKLYGITYSVSHNAIYFHLTIIGCKNNK